MKGNTLSSHFLIHGRANMRNCGITRRRASVSYFTLHLRAKMYHERPQFVEPPHRLIAMSILKIFLINVNNGIAVFL